MRSRICQTARVVPDFRYAQFCPLARAAEIVGERWTLLILRELLIGPKRFSDLQAPLAGVSSSVLADRLGKLAQRGLVRRRQLPPPAAATVYELTESGQGLLPAILELARWGTRQLGVPEPGDHIEPSWLKLGMLTIARRAPTPARTYRLTAVVGDREASVRVSGGPAGTVVLDEDGEAEATLRADLFTLLAVASGFVAVEQAVGNGTLSVAGDPNAMLDFSALFEMDPPTPENQQAPENQQGA